MPGGTPLSGLRNPSPVRTVGQEESLAKRILPRSERLLMTEAAIHGPLLDDRRSAIAAVDSE